MSEEEKKEELIREKDEYGNVLASSPSPAPSARSRSALLSVSASAGGYLAVPDDGQRLSFCGAFRRRRGVLK